VTLNSAAARLTGSYRFASGDANTPAAGVAGTVEVIAASAAAVNQMAFDSASSRMFTRFWNGTVWSAWSEIWRTTGAAESIGANGWQRLPSGLIFQWGLFVRNSGTANVFYSFNFPITFPTTCLFLTGSQAVDPPGVNSGGNMSVTGIVSASQGRVSFNNTFSASDTGIRWWAVGN